MFRATLKSLLSRKTRLLLSGFAVVLGVMAVSGALIVTDTINRSFESLFRTANAQVDVQVTGEKTVTREGPEGAATEPVSQDTIDRIADVPGVDSAIGTVMSPGVRVLGKDGKVLVKTGPPTFGMDWPSLAANKGLVDMRSGRAPTSDDEVALSADLAAAAGVSVGEKVDLMALQPRDTYTVVGVFGYSGGRDTVFGESRVAFTPDVAKQQMLGGEVTGFGAVNVTAAPGLAPDRLKDRIADELGDDFQVRTGEEVADTQAASTAVWIDLIRQVLLGFAAVALIVGVFLILNTFSILVNQRTGELAVLRSLGASRPQIIGSVLVEALVVGLLAATVGLAAGYGLAGLLKYVMETFSGADLPLEGLTVPGLAVAAAYLVGPLVTVFAAVLPAVRASRVPPVAALRASAVEQRPVWMLSAAGAVLLAAGAAALGYTVYRGAPLWLLVGGVVASFIGAALLTPLVSRPVVSLLGRAFSWSTPGELGRRNSARNPRRTAITATALMLGISLVTGVGVLASSLQASITNLVQTDLDADLVITSGAASGPQQPGIGGYDPGILDDARDIDGVTDAVPLYTDVGEAGDEQVTIGSGSLPDLAPVFTLDATAGTLRELDPGEVAVSKQFADDHGVAVGDTVELSTVKGGGHTYTLVGIYEGSELVPPTMLSRDDADARFRTTQPTGGYLRLAGDADPAAVRTEVADLLADNPDYSVADQSEYAAQQASQVDTFVMMLYILSGLAIVIAVLGIVNTLALSIVERVREIGLLRAVGLLRRQVTWMVTAESVVIAVFGAALGVVVGAGLGVAAARALRDQGLEQLALPWTPMGLFLAGAVVIGLVAAVLPAVRASRVDMLRAISYE
ncbi:MAG: ABC transporter permease [Micromonosporaceae bacterium]